jgi:hypothetical protein
MDGNIYKLLLIGDKLLIIKMISIKELIFHYLLPVYCKGRVRKLDKAYIKMRIKYWLDIGLLCIRNFRKLKMQLIYKDLLKEFKDWKEF